MLNTAWGDLGKTFPSQVSLTFVHVTFDDIEIRKGDVFLVCCEYVHWWKIRRHKEGRNEMSGEIGRLGWVREQSWIFCWRLSPFVVILKHFTSFRLATPSPATDCRQEFSFTFYKFPLNEHHNICVQICKNDTLFAWNGGAFLHDVVSFSLCSVTCVKQQHCRSYHPWWFRYTAKYVIAMKLKIKARKRGDEATDRVHDSSTL